MVHRPTLPPAGLQSTVDRLAFYFMQAGLESVPLWLATHSQQTPRLGQLSDVHGQSFRFFSLLAHSAIEISSFIECP